MTEHGDLQILLREVPAEEEDHTRWILKAAAIIGEAIRREGLEATLVGGGAVGIYAPGAHTTTDLDFVVPRRWGVDYDEAIRSAMTALGFSQVDRHWVLRVLRKELVLAYRIVGYWQWRYTDYAAQAIALIRAFGDELDEGILLPRLRREDSEDAYVFLREIAFSDRPITDEILRDWLDGADS